MFKRVREMGGTREGEETQTFGEDKLYDAFGRRDSNSRYKLCDVFVYSCENSLFG